MISFKMTLVCFNSMYYIYYTLHVPYTQILIIMIIFIPVAMLALQFYFFMFFWKKISLWSKIHHLYNKLNVFSFTIFVHPYTCVLAFKIPFYHLCKNLIDGRKLRRSYSGTSLVPVAHGGKLLRNMHHGCRAWLGSYAIHIMATMTLCSVQHALLVFSSLHDAFCFPFHLSHHINVYHISYKRVWCIP